jgi:hypothetical protein
VLGPAQYVAYQADPGLKGTIVESPRCSRATWG